MKPYGDEATDFHDKKMPQVGSNHTYLAVISLYSALEKDKSYYLQEFLKERQYIVKEKRVIRHITEDIECFSSNSDEE